MKILIFSVLATFFIVHVSLSVEQKALSEKINTVIAPYHAKVGVASIHTERTETCIVNNNQHYVMQSVYKFHLAVTVFHLIDKGVLSLDQKVYISKKELQVDTWSPISEKYSKGNVTLTVREILSYTISQSDNIDCDVLFKLVGGTLVVQNYMNSIGIKDVSIKYTEQQMHDNHAFQFTNWTTPLAAVELLTKTYTSSVLSEGSKAELWRMMRETTTGPKRLKGLLPKDVVVAHKTGSSGKDKKGITVATNDIGMITLPNGDHVFLAVFVTTSSESEETNDEIIAKIARVVWEYYTTK